MANKMLIDATHPEETRVVVVRGNRVQEFDFEAADKKPLRGNIYLAKVTRVEPSLQAAFVDYGGNRHGFLAFAEIHPARDAGIHHPLEGTVDRRATDAPMLAPDDVHEVVGAEVSLLTEEHLEYLFAFTGPFAAVRFQPGDVLKADHTVGGARN